MKRTWAHHLGELLVARGSTHAFGIPGGEVLALLDGLAKGGVEFHLARHETPACFMAEGTWHATGAPGVVIATLGPGVANAVNGIANAHQDRVPLIVLTGRIDPADATRYTHQVFDHQALLRPITKRTHQLRADDDPRLVADLLDEAARGRPGPVHLDIPIAVAGAGLPLVSRASGVSVGPEVQAPHPDSLAKATQTLRSARRPLVVAGLDVLSDGDGARTRAFLERLRAPVITTYKAAGLLPPGHPLLLGPAGLSPKADAILLPVVDQADVILCLGYDPIEMRKGWIDAFSESSVVVDVGTVAPNHGVHRSDIVVTTQDFRVGIAALQRGIGSAPLSRDVDWLEQILPATRHSLDEAFAPTGGFDAVGGLHALSRALPDDARVSVDTGAHRILFNHVWRVPRLRGVVQSSGLCTMGCALPLAIGMAKAHPGRPTLALAGDGGLEMVAGELASARDLGVALTLVVIDDRSLALIEMKQRAMRLSNRGVDYGTGEAFTGSDYVSLARAFGATGHRVESSSELEHRVASSFGEPGVKVIVCRVPRKGYDDRI